MSQNIDLGRETLRRHTENFKSKSVIVIVAGTDHTVCTAATAGKQGSVASVRRADRSGARRIQHVCKCNVDPVKSDLTKLLCFS